jgi:peptide/nickel transport system permease protein
MEQRLPITVELGLLGVGFSLIVGIPLGIWAAARRGSPIDVLASYTAAIGIAVPDFVLALILIFIFSLVFRLLPPSGFVPFAKSPADNLKLMALPAVTMGLYLTAFIVRITRSSLTEVLDLEYITTARTKGLSPRKVLSRHAIKNAMIPVSTMVGLQLGYVLGGAVIIETMFALPGLGKLTIDALFARDFPVVQGAVLIMSLGYLITNIVVDLLYAYLDPRIKYV